MTDTNRPLWQVPAKVSYDGVCLDEAARPPLWQVMQDAWDDVPEYVLSVERAYIAAQIRAIADWLVPEEEPEPLPLEDQIAWVARCNMRQRLLAEADRAEAGE
jgi:hypothetical protein